MAGHVQKDKQALERFRMLAQRISDSSTVNPLESKETQNKRIKKGKNNFKYFVETYFKHYAESDTPDFHIRISRKVRRNKKYKGWLKWARGHAKSVVAIVLLPLWLWINGDIHFLLVVGQNEDKAKTLLGDLQAEFEHNHLLIHDFGSQKLKGNWEDGFFKTKSGFKAKAIGIGQDPRGLRVGADRPDMIVADDWEDKKTKKNQQRQKEYAEWFLRGVIPAMDNKNRRVLICQNHFAPEMIFSFVVEKNKTWDIDRVDAYDPVTYEPTWKEKYDRWFFKEVEDEIGALAAMAEYNNTPHVEGKLFLDEYFQWARLPRVDSFTTIIGRWDVAYAGSSTSDYNAIRVWGLHKGKKYLIDCFVKQSKVKTALQWIADFQKRYPRKVQIGFESQFWNDEIKRLIKEVNKEHKMTLNLIKIDRRSGNKYDHMITMLPQYQNSRIVFNEALKSHNDTQVGLAQIKGLEPGYTTKDDAPDADVYAFDELDRYERKKESESRVTKRESRKY